MVTIKQYAKDNNISYEAVRKQISRYNKELKSFIITKGRTRFLTSEAIEFLDSKRNENPVVIINSSKEEELKKLEVENKNLLLKIAGLQESLIAEKEKVNLLNEEKIKLIEVSDSYKKSLFGFYRKK